MLYRFDLADLIDPHGWRALVTWFLKRSPELGPMGEDGIPWPADRSRAAMESWLEEDMIHAKLGTVM